VLTRIDLRGRRGEDLRGVLPRAAVEVADAAEIVRPVVEDVAARGLAAVLDASERFDGVRPEPLRVPAEALAEALAALAPDVRAALEESARRHRTLCRAQLPQERTVEIVDGGTVTERWLPVERVGLYVPGGRLAYPSSVVMNVVPAQVAGVRSLAVASPPQADGLPHRVVLAACALLGVEEVYAVGGAQAVAMLAHGTEVSEPVDVITGPGNVYVTAAKRLVHGRCAIDSEAGPTEIAVLADSTAVPEHVAADLVSQAEHDPQAACLLVSDSADLLDAVDVELGKQVPVTPNRERVEAALSGQSAHVLVDDLDQGLDVVDAWAAEHLEVITADADQRARRVRNAGAVFVGPHTPVSLGDYAAGSNHVLPTGGTARFSAGLSVHSFLKRVSLVTYTREALAEAAPHVTALGGSEDLPAHVDAVQVRLRPARS
jgi:histidinol dehydrogenase